MGALLSLGDSLDILWDDLTKLRAATLRVTLLGWGLFAQNLYVDAHGRVWRFFLVLVGLSSPKIEEDDQIMEILVCQWRGYFLGPNAPVMALRALYGLFVVIGLRALFQL